jgi:hypothetical protein
MLNTLQSASIETRIEHILQSVKTAGFENIDSLISSYYTQTFGEKSAAKIAQRVSRSRGLPELLETLRLSMGSWSQWQANGYRDAVARSTADLIGDEFDRLLKKRYNWEIELQHHRPRQRPVPLPQPQPQKPLNGGAVDPADVLTERLQWIASELKSTLKDEVGLSLNSLQMVNFVFVC